MGVTYKLKDEVVQYILELKQANALLSCRLLAEGVQNQFGLHLSKSSVHEVLKDANISSSRGRKPKDSFAIPKEKKQLIQANLTKALAPLVKPIIPPIPSQHVVQAARVDEISKGIGEIFIKATFWDLCPYHTLGIKSFDDFKNLGYGRWDTIYWKYLITEGCGVRVTLEDESFYYVNLRSGNISAGNPGLIVGSMPIERAIRQTVDCLVNNIEPLRVRKPDVGENTEAFDSFISSFQSKNGKKINKIEIVDSLDHIYAELILFVEQKRRFTVENNTKVDLMHYSPQVFNEDSNVEQDAQWLMGQLKKRAKEIFAPEFEENAWADLCAFGGVVEHSGGNINITISAPSCYDNNENLMLVAQRFNALRLEDEQGMRIFMKNYCPSG